MNICLGFFGFVREKINYEQFVNFKKLLPPNSIIDVFVSCPSIVDELTNEEINYESFINEMTDIFKNSSIYVNLYKYEPFIHIDKTRKLNIPDFITNHNLYSFRVVSLTFSIDVLSTFIHKHIIEENKNYDNIILTRFDLFNTIKSFGDCLIYPENGMRIIRDVNLHAEDRIIITKKIGLEKLTNLYKIYDIEYHSLCITNEEFFVERILLKYLNTFNDIVLLKQENLVIGLSTRFHDKYNKHDFFKKILHEFNHSEVLS